MYLNWFENYLTVVKSISRRIGRNMNKSRFRYQIDHYKGLKGMESGKQLILEYHQKHQRTPLRDLSKFIEIKTAIHRGYWQEYGIQTWRHFINFCGLEYRNQGGWNKRFDLRRFEGSAGLEEAKRIIQDYYQRTNKTPTTRNKHFKGVARALYNGYWSEYGIGKWHDLIAYCGLDPTQIPGTEPKYNLNFYKGQKGLDLAIKKIKNYAEKYNRAPVASKTPWYFIKIAISRGYWYQQGIMNWTDILKKCGLQLSQSRTSHKVQSQLENYKGLTGLTRAKNQITAYAKRHKRSPSLSFPAFHLTIKALSRKFWTEFGIVKWSDLLKECGLQPFNANQFVKKIDKI